MISLNSIIFNGMDATPIDVQVQLSSGLSKPEFNIIGLADRAVKESAERIRNVILRIGEGADNYIVVPAMELEWYQKNEDNVD